MSQKGGWSPATKPIQSAVCGMVISFCIGFVQGAFVLAYPHILSLQSNILAPQRTRRMEVPSWNAVILSNRPWVRCLFGCCAKVLANPTQPSSNNVGVCVCVSVECYAQSRRPTACILVHIYICTHCINYNYHIYIYIYISTCLFMFGFRFVVGAHIGAHAISCIQSLKKVFGIRCEKTRPQYCQGLTP